MVWDTELFAGSSKPATSGSLLSVCVLIGVYTFSAQVKVLFMVLFVCSGNEIFILCSLVLQRGEPGSCGNGCNAMQSKSNIYTQQ